MIDDTKMTKYVGCGVCNAPVGSPHLEGCKEEYPDISGITFRTVYGKVRLTDIDEILKPLGKND